MKVNATAVRQLADDVVRAISPNLCVAGVVLSASGSEYAEVIVDITGSRREPNRFAIGVLRKAPLSVLRDQLTARLRTLVTAHGVS